MRIFGRSLVIAVLLLISTEQVSADTRSTPINTQLFSEIGEQKTQNNPFLLAIAHTVFTTHANANKNDTIVSTQRSTADEATFAKWKIKQQSLWDTLPKDSFIINASAYTAAADECGKSDGITASGVKVQEHQTLACPANYPFGAKIEIKGYGVYTCEDRGGAIKGNHIDVYMKTKKEAFAFGRRNLEARIVQ